MIKDPQKYKCFTSATTPPMVIACCSGMVDVIFCLFSFDSKLNKSNHQCINQIKNSSLWNNFTIYELQQPIRQSDDPVFTKFLDKIRNGMMTNVPLNMPFLQIYH